MTETELACLHSDLQNLLHNQNYADLFDELTNKIPSAKGYQLEQLRNELIGGHIDVKYHQRVLAFLNKCVSEEREKLNVALDKATFEKEQHLAKLDEEIGKKERMLEELKKKIHKLKIETSSEIPSPANIFYSLAALATLTINKGIEDKKNCLKNLKIAIGMYSPCKEICKQDKDFEWLWEDEDFKRLVA